MRAARLLRRGLAVLATPCALLYGQTAMLPAAPAAEMKPFVTWLGEWKGSGWSLDSAGRRTAFTLAETVRLRVGGKVLLLEGQGRSTAENGPLTHDGLVVLSYDPRTSHYRWYGHELGSAAIDVEPLLTDGGLAWTLRVNDRGTAVRFTITIDGDRWREAGDVTADGANWSRFMEVQLERSTR